MKTIARVVVEGALDKAFDYQIPPEWIERASLGSKVRAPFGSRELVGYIVELRDGTEVKNVKPLREVLGEKPFLPPAIIQLANWMAEYYCAPLGQVFRGLLPESVRHAETSFKQRLWVEPRPGLKVAEVEPTLSKTKSQKRAWEFLTQEGPGWLVDLCRHTETTAAVWRALEDKGFVQITVANQERDPFATIPVTSSTPLLLNEEQRAALELIAAERTKAQPKPILLHGVTGSGKTEIYLQAIAQVLEEGQTALVLVPEIALTPQTVERFRARFLGHKLRIAVLHSHLSAGERHDQWQQIHQGRARLVIGARSAVFAPLENLGLIVVDEEHETSYKQEESPHYQARDVAIMRGHLEKAPVVLGSATPSLESFYHAQQGKYRLSRLTKRVEDIRMPTLHLVDLRPEFKKTKKPTLLGERMIAAVQQRLTLGEQVILFLNRRGYAVSLQCPTCGNVEMCPHCSVPLTWHRAAGKVQCHFCDYTKPAPRACPACHYPDYDHTGMGTERIEQAVTDIFPKARVVRMDSDSMRGKEAYRKTLEDFAARKIDILVGTQMIAKGLHFPNVTMVGVVQADSALQLPDFRASERVFQLLMQVAGRAGRGAVTGEVFVQTRTPFHPAIQFARHHDFEGFAEQELEFRRGLHYPPYQRMALLTWRGRDEEKTHYVAEQMAKKIATILPKGVEASGPAPAPLAKINQEYRFHYLLRTAHMSHLSKVLRPLVVGVKAPDGVKMTLDVDPVYLL